MIIVPMSQQDAEKIASWRYDPPYSFYNMDLIPEELAAFLDPLQREKDGFISVYKQHELIGFFCFQDREGDVVIGLGMRPDLTGEGLGLKFVQRAMSFAREKYRPLSFSLAVATFNKRAIKVYERTGFKPIDTKIRVINGARYEFINMKLDLSSE